MRIGILSVSGRILDEIEPLRASAWKKEVSEAQTGPISVEESVARKVSFAFFAIAFAALAVKALDVVSGFQITKLPDYQITNDSIPRSLNDSINSATHSAPHECNPYMPEHSRWFASPAQSARDDKRRA